MVARLYKVVTTLWHYRSQGFDKVVAVSKTRLTQCGGNDVTRLSLCCSKVENNPVNNVVATLYNLVFCMGWNVIC